MDNKSIPENDKQAGLASPAAQGTGEPAPPLVGDGSVHSQLSPVVSVAVDDVGNILDVSRLTGNLTGTQGTVTAPSPAHSVRSPHGSVAGNGSMAVGSPSQMTTSSPSMVPPAPVAGPGVDQAEARVMFPQGRLPSPTMEEIRREAKLHSLHSQLNNIYERMKTESNPKHYSDLQYRYDTMYSRWEHLSRAVKEGRVETSRKMYGEKRTGDRAGGDPGPSPDPPSFLDRYDDGGYLVMSPRSALVLPAQPFGDGAKPKSVVTVPAGPLVGNAGGDFSQHYRPPVLRTTAPQSHQLSVTTTTTTVTRSVGQQGQLGLAPVTMVTGLQGPMPLLTSTPGLPVHRQAVSLGQLPGAPADNPRAYDDYRKSPQLLPVPPAPLTIDPRLAAQQAMAVGGQQSPAPQLMTPDLVAQIVQQVSNQMMGQLGGVPVKSPVSPPMPYDTPVHPAPVASSAPQNPSVSPAPVGQWSVGVDGSSRPSTPGLVRRDAEREIVEIIEAEVLQLPAADAMDLIRSAENTNVITPGEARLLVIRRLRAESGQNMNRPGEPAPSTVQWADDVGRAQTQQSGLRAASRPPVPAMSQPGPPRFTPRYATSYPTQPSSYQDPPGTGGHGPGRTPRGQSYDEGWSQYQGSGLRDQQNRYDDERAGRGWYEDEVHSGGKSYYPQVPPRAPAPEGTPAYLNLDTPTESRRVQVEHSQPLRADVDIDPMNVSRAWRTSCAPDSTYTIHRPRDHDGRDPAPRWDSYHDDYTDSDPHRRHYGESALERKRQREAEAALKNLIFDGEEKSNSVTWEFFADRFQLAAETARWDARAIKLRLMSCLRGGASRTISHLTGEATYKHVWDTLRQRYSAIGQEASFEVKLAKRTRNLAKESPQAYLDDITYLCRNAFPRSSESDLQESVKKFFLMGHPESYQNHLNAAVNLRTGTTEDLLQACRQYERMEIQRRNVSAKKPVVRHLVGGSSGKSWQKEAALALLDYRDSCTESEDCEDAPELDVFRTTTRKSRRRHPKSSKTKERAGPAVRAVEPYPESPAPTGTPVESWAECIDLTDSEDEMVDESIAKISAALNALGTGAPADGKSAPNRPRLRNMPCLYCTKLGHGFRFCPKLLSEYPDKKIPPKVALSLFQKLMDLKSARRERQSNSRSGQRDRRSKGKNLLAITAPAEGADGKDSDGMSLNP